MFTKEDERLITITGFCNDALVRLGIDLAANASHHQRVVVHGHYANYVWGSHTTPPCARQNFDDTTHIPPAPPSKGLFRSVSIEDCGRRMGQVVFPRCRDFSPCFPPVRRELGSCS